MWIFQVDRTFQILISEFLYRLKAFDMSIDIFNSFSKAYFAEQKRKENIFGSIDYSLRL